MHLPAPKNAVFRGPHPTQLASPISSRVFFNILLAFRTEKNMQYNPYAPPQAPMPPMMPQGGPGPNVGPSGWTVGEAISAGWEAVKSQFVTLVFTFLVSGIPNVVISQISGAITKQYADPGNPLQMFSEPGYWIVTAGFTIPTSIVAAFFQGGLIKIWLSAARGQTASFGDLFGGGRSFLSILAITLLQQLVFVFSLPFLLVPALVFSTGMALAPFYVVDEGIGAIDALKKSWGATTGQKGSIFLFQLASAGVLILGFVACCIGVVAAFPVVMVGMAFIYVRLSGNVGEPSGFGGPPMGGYGGPPYGAPPAGGFGGPPNAGGFGPGPGGFGPPQPPQGYGPPGGYGGPPMGGGGYGGPQGGGGPQGY